MDTNPGPVDGSVLYEQERHVSAAVWDGQERGALRCHEHTSKLGEWRLTPKQEELVESAGFGHLRRIPAISLDNPLISALVERWRRETNTFHFSVGEMTVTLQDVALLLGLAIDGKAVIGVTHTTCASVCLRLLGKAPDSNYASGGMVKLSWLKEFFSQLSKDAPMEEVERCTRAYLLYLVGSTIFSTTTGNKVPVMYLPLFEDFDETGRYAWGAAALAFLYRALGNACVKSQSTICGCLTLLQCWSYYHLNIGRPKLNRDPIHNQFPFVLQWKGKQSGPTTNRDVVFYRKALDSLKPIDVEWLPYKYVDSTVIPEDIRKALIFGRAKTMLICFDKAERHLPDRCLRQYGMSQSIPEDVEQWVRKSRGVDGGVDLSGKMESELNEWLERHLHIVDGDDDGDELEYMDWYLQITRRIVGRPISLSSEFQRTISGLKEIAYLADSFSTKGLDGQQFESISRIRFIAQDCLRDQTATPATPPPHTPVELGKRIRGKERVRKRGGGKRRRKDDPMEYQEPSDDDNLPPYGVIIEVDQLQLRHVNGKVGQLSLTQENNVVGLCQLPPAVSDDDKSEQEHESSSVNVALPGKEIDDVQPCEVMDKIIDSHCSEETENGDCQTSERIEKLDNFQPCIDVDEVKDSQMSDATTNRTDDLQPYNDLKDSQLATMKDKVHDTHHHDTENKVNESHVCEAITNDVLGSQFHNMTKKVDDSNLCDAMDIQVDEAKLLSETEEVNDPQLHGAIEKVADLKLSDLTEEANNSNLTDSVKEANDQQLLVAVKENNNCQLNDAAEEVSHSQNTDATNTTKCSPLLDSTKEANNFHSQPFKEENYELVPYEAHAGYDSQLYDKSQVVNDLELAGKLTEESNLCLEATQDENDLLPADTTEVEAEVQLPDKPCAEATKVENDLLSSDKTKVEADVQLPGKPCVVKDLQLPSKHTDVNDTCNPSLRCYVPSRIRIKRHPPQAEVVTEDVSTTSHETAKDFEK